jgi:hypothetical protein
MLCPISLQKPPIQGFLADAIPLSASSPLFSVPVVCLVLVLIVDRSNHVNRHLATSAAFTPCGLVLLIFTYYKYRIFTRAVINFFCPPIAKNAPAAREAFGCRRVLIRAVRSVVPYVYLWCGMVYYLQYCTLPTLSARRILLLQYTHSSWRKNQLGLVVPLLGIF